MRPVREALLPWKSNKYYIFVRVCARVCVPERVGVCLRVFVQHAARMRHIVMSFLVPQYFSILSHKRQDFRKRKVIEHKTCVLIFSKTFA